jgi:hypothetical protein
VIKKESEDQTIFVISSGIFVILSDILVHMLQCSTIFVMLSDILVILFFLAATITQPFL